MRKKSFQNIFIPFFEHINIIQLIYLIYCAWEYFATLIYIACYMCNKKTIKKHNPIS